MSKKIVSMAFVAIVLSGIFIWIGCGKNENAEECVTCKSKRPDLIKNVAIDSRTFSVGFYKLTSHPNLSFGKVQNESVATAALMQQFLQAMDTENSFDKLLKDGYVPVNYNLYFKNNLRQHSEANKENLQAIGLIMYKNQGLNYFFFSKNGSDGLSIDSRYSATVRHLNVADVFLVFNRIINQNPNEAYSVITMVVPEYMNVRGKIKTRNELPDRLRSVGSNTLRTSFYEDGGEKCDPEICLPIQDSPGVCEQVIGDMACVEKEDAGGICPKNDVAKAAGKQAEFDNMRASFYTLRDSILQHSVNGKEIIDRYYSSGKYIFAGINQVDVGRLWNFIVLMHEKTDILLTNPESDQVLISDETQNDATKTIYDLRSISAEQEWQENLDWMQSIVDKFAGQPAREVYAYIKS